MSDSAAPTVVILAAGQGTRMKSPRPKVLQPLCGRPMLAWVVDQALGLDPERVVVVAGHGADEVERALAEHGFAERVEVVVQEPQLGTGHALQVAARALEGRGAPETLVVLYGDMPLPDAPRPSTSCSPRAARWAPMAWRCSPPCVQDPTRVRARPARGRPETGTPSCAIVEEKDATPAERDVEEVNVGVYAFPGPAAARAAAPRLSNDNAQGEYYLTDVVSACSCATAERTVAGVVLEDERGGHRRSTPSVHLAEAR